MSGGLGFSTLGCSGAPLDEVLRTAQRHGSPAVELRAADDEPLNRRSAPALLEEARQQMERAGVLALSVCSYVRLCAPGPVEDDDEQVEDLLAHLRLAATLGSPAVRVFMRDLDATADVGPDPSAGERRALQRLRSVMDRDDSGARVLVETHDSHSVGARTARFMAQVDQAVPGHTCGVVWDTAHTWVHGESPARSLDLLSPWLGYVQVKDVRSREDATPVPLGAGAYPVAELSDALQTHGWDGGLSLEWERKWHPQLPTIDEALEAAATWAAPLLGRRPA